MIKTQGLITSILFILLICACGKEEATVQGPSTINLSNATLYELLPQETIVATLSTDVLDDDMRFLLVTGEGATNNSQFEIKGNILRTKRKLEYAEGSTRSIRIKATDGVSEYEATVAIALQKFEGTYPTISSSSFEHNGPMPREFGADNGNVSPDLNLTDIPPNTVSILLTMRDLDDGGSYHWAVWNIPPGKERIFQKERWENGVIEGNNSFGEGYTGPFPPTEHRYEVAAIFLSDNLSLQASEYTSLTQATIGKIIAYSAIVGKYKP